MYHLCPAGHHMDWNLPDLVVPTVNSDLEVLAAPALAMRYETLVRMSRAIGVHRDLKELFGILMDELHGVVQFDFIGVSLRDQDSDKFQNYFIDTASRSEFVPEEQLMPEETQDADSLINTMREKFPSSDLLLAIERGAKANVKP